MKRISCSPRPDWPAKVEKVGLTYHTTEGHPYWDESAYYQLTASEVDELEKTGNDLHMMCIEAAEEIITKNLFSELGIPDAAVPLIKRSWDRDDFSLYGRFDFAYDGTCPPKLLEYNADTPTALVEAAVAQWYWLEESHPQADQFNSIHEHLIAAWKKYKADFIGKIHLGGVRDHLEDEQTVLYIQDTCFQAGLEVEQLFLEDLGYDSHVRRFVDMAGNEVRNYFKLYPWEWLWHEEFSSHLSAELIHFIEPMWKMLLSNKGILPILWRKYPGHPNLLPAYFSAEELVANHGPQSYVRKRKLSREGANISLIENGVSQVETPGEYGDEGYVFQSLASLGDFHGNHPVMGVWVVNHEACGLGIREDTTRITGNCSRFVPHLFET